MNKPRKEKPDVADKPAKAILSYGENASHVLNSYKPFTVIFFRVLLNHQVNQMIAVRRSRAEESPHS